MSLSRDDVLAMLASSRAFRVAPSAAAGVREALDCLRREGFGDEQVMRYSGGCGGDGDVGEARAASAG